MSCRGIAFFKTFYLFLVFMMTAAYSWAGEPLVIEGPELLQVPRELAGRDDFTIAAASPRIVFSTVQGLEPLPTASEGIWTNFSEGVCSSTGKFYVAFSNNADIDGNSCVYEYDMSTHQHRRVLDLARLLDQKPGEFGHGKLHGRLDEMPDGWIYMATFCSITSEKLSAEQKAKVGSRLVRYNTRTGETQDLGMPVLGDTFPMNGTDTRHGIFHGVGLLGGYLAYDLRAQRCLYKGSLPTGIGWSDRATLIDPDTGFCFSSDPASGQIDQYDPKENRFSKTPAFVPEHPAGKQEAHPGIRCYTRSRLADGSFIVQTSSGVMFSFFPDDQRTRLIGLNWLDGCYCPATALSRDGRFLYYTPGTHKDPVPGGNVIVQLDTRTHARKVIAFLDAALGKRTTYRLGTSYSINLDTEDARLLITWNGHVPASAEDAKMAGEPSFMSVEIPVSERKTTQAVR